MKQSFVLAALLLILCLLYYTISFKMPFYIKTSLTQSSLKLTTTLVPVTTPTSPTQSLLKLTTTLAPVTKPTSPTQSLLKLTTTLASVTTPISPTQSSLKLTTTLVPVTKPEPNDYFYPKGQDNTIPVNYTTLLKELPKFGCKNLTNLLVAIRTGPAEFIERDWVRNNWGKFRNPDTPMIFLLGNSRNETINLQINEEQKKYGDLLLLNYDDHYRNLSLKNLALFKYFDEFCPNANCLAKPDVDTVVNILGIEKMCNLSSTTEKLIRGYVLSGIGIDRQPGNRWYVPRYVYPKETYDAYTVGWGFLITGKNTVKDFINAILNKTPLMISENYRRIPDDALFFGDIRTLANITIQSSGGFGTRDVSLWKDPSTNEFIPLMSHIGQDKKIQLDIWDKFQKVLKMNQINKSLDNMVKTMIYFKNLQTNATKAEIIASIPGLQIVCQILSVISKEEAERFKEFRQHCP